MNIIKYLLLKYDLKSGELVTASQPDYHLRADGKYSEQIGVLLGDDWCNVGRTSSPFIRITYYEMTGELIVTTDLLGSYLQIYYTVNEEAVYLSTSLEKLLSMVGMPGRLEEKMTHHFIRHGFIPGSGTLLKGISKVPPNSVLSVTRSGIHIECKATLYNEDAVTSNTEYFAAIQSSVIKSYINHCVSTNCKPAIALSAGFDSNYILWQAVQNNKELTTISVFGERGQSEKDFVNEIGQVYSISPVFCKVGSDSLGTFEEIVRRLDGSVFEPGIFLQFELARRLQALGCDAIICGECADQVYNENFYKTPAATVQDYKFGSNPYELAAYIVLKKSGIMLNSFGIRPYYPFCDAEIIRIGSMFRKENEQDKKLHKELCKSVFPAEISAVIKKRGGSTEPCALFSSEEASREFIREVYATSKYFKSDCPMTRRFGPVYDYELQYALTLRYLELFEKIFTRI